MLENKQGNVPRYENTELCGVENIQNYSFFWEKATLLLLDKY